MSIQGNYTLTLDTRPGRRKVEVWQLGRRLTHERAMTVLLIACEQEARQPEAACDTACHQRCAVLQLGESVT